MRKLAAVLGTLLVGAFVFSFANPLMCSAGCGNLLEPIFSLFYSMFGPWGVRTLLLACALLFFVGALGRRE
jgi:hypothetical protein